MKNDSIQVSIILTVYNTEFVLVKRAIESVLKQDDENFELLIVNDGSKDELTIPLKKYIDELKDSRILYFFHSNRGFPKTLNRGIEEATGEYIGFCDSDDEYKPNHISKCLEQMDKYDLIASVTETVVDNDDEYYVPDRFDNTKNIHVDDCIITGTLFGKASVFKELLFKDIYSQDYELFERANEKYKVAKLELKTYIYYRNNQDSICSQLKKKQ
jgi:glycosyltransferase involved in cell wall biosynthesis